MSLNSLTRLTATVKKEKPFGAHFTTRLEGVNSKLTCALGFNHAAHECGTTINDDYAPLPDCYRTGECHPP